jgi:hypothetical protein
MRTHTFTFVSIEFLLFGDTRFAGDLAPLPTNLVSFDCAFTLISGGLVDATFAGLNSLLNVDMSGIALNATIPSVFSSLEKLQFLYIVDSFISGDLSYMEGMPAIVEHWVDSNSITGTIPTFVGALANLGSFSVLSNNIEGNIPSELGNLGIIVKFMWFYDNLLTGIIPTDLGKMSLIEILRFDGNNIGGTMPSQICDNTFRRLNQLGSDCNTVTVSDFDGKGLLRFPETC